MRWAEWTAGGRVPEDVLDDVLQLLARGLAPPASVPDADSLDLNALVWTTLWMPWGTVLRVTGGNPW